MFLPSNLMQETLRGLGGSWMRVLEWPRYLKNLQSGFGAPRTSYSAQGRPSQRRKNTYQLLRFTSKATEVGFEKGWLQRALLSVIHFIKDVEVMKVVFVGALRALGGPELPSGWCGPIWTRDWGGDSDGQRQGSAPTLRAEVSSKISQGFCWAAMAFYLEIHVARRWGGDIQKCNMKPWAWSLVASTSLDLPDVDPIFSVFRSGHRISSMILEGLLEA